MMLRPKMARKPMKVVRSHFEKFMNQSFENVAIGCWVSLFR